MLIPLYILPSRERDNLLEPGDVVTPVPFLLCPVCCARTHIVAQIVHSIWMDELQKWHFIRSSPFSGAESIRGQGFLLDICSHGNFFRTPKSVSFSTNHWFDKNKLLDSCVVDPFHGQRRLSASKPHPHVSKSDKINKRENMVAKKKKHWCKKSFWPGWWKVFKTA